MARKLFPGVLRAFGLSAVYRVSQLRVKVQVPLFCHILSQSLLFGYLYLNTLYSL